MSRAQTSAALVERYGARVVTEAMRPLLSDERVDRIERVLDARLVGLTVVLEDIYDPHNGAAALRSIEGLGVGAVHVIETANPFPVAPAVTIGCDKWMDIHRHRDLDGARASIEAAGMTLVAAAPGAGDTLDDIPALEPMALMFGNEREGLSPAALAACHRTIEIPMFGFSRSFNLSVSVALLVARAAERRRAALGQLGDADPEIRAKWRAQWYARDVRGAAEIVDRYVSMQTRPPWPL